MTAYSLTGLVGTGMGTVTTESQDKSCNLFFTAMPGSDSSDAVLIDLFGASRDITISGIYTTDNGSIEAFITALDALCNGQQTIKDFVSGKSGTTYKVLVDSVNWEAEESGVTFVKYTIVMKEGAV